MAINNHQIQRSPNMEKAESGKEEPLVAVATSGAGGCE